MIRIDGQSLRDGASELKSKVLIERNYPSSESYKSLVARTVMLQGEMHTVRWIRIGSLDYGREYLVEVCHTFSRLDL